MRALLVHNPYSRKALKQKEIEFIKQELSVVYSTDIFETKGIGTIASYVKETGEAYDLIIACGGDGTIHEAACGILDLNKKPKLAIIPRGTMNDVARGYKIPKNLRKCIEIIKKGNSEAHCAFQINETYFLYGLALGRYADVAYQADRKRELGRLAYYVACFKEFFVSKPTYVTINGKDEKVSQLFILNTKCVAGYKVDCREKKKVSLQILDTKNRLRDTIKFWFFLLSKSHRHCKVLNEECIKITGHNLIFTLDGEKYVTDCAIIQRLNDSIEILK